MQASTIGLDLAKHVFQVHGVDAEGAVVVRRRLRRGEVLRFFTRLERCVVGMEACATSHYWAREIGALGHAVKLLPPAYVKPYVKRGKTDALDAEAICEAVQRPVMRFVPVKSAAQQGELSLHRVRELLVRQRTMLANSLRSQLAEFGLVAAKGIGKLAPLLAILADATDERLPALARQALRLLAAQLEAAEAQLRTLDAAVRAQHRRSEAALRLATIPGVGPLIASAIVATVPDPQAFRSGRHFAAWLGLTPRQNASGGKERKARTSKMGNRYLRTLLVLGATAVVGMARRTRAPQLAWVLRLLERKPPRLVTLALANKTARIVWALLARGGTYRAPAAA